MTGTQQSGSSTPPSALIGTWVLDTSATTVELHTKAMWGMAKVTGHLTATEGGGIVGADGSVTGTLVLDAGSIDTAQKKRDKHLRSADFFDVEKYPTLTYSVTSAQLGADGSVTIAGDLSVRGQTHPLPVSGTTSLTGPDKATIRVEADLDRSQWCIDFTKMGARLDNHLVVEAVFTRS